MNKRILFAALLALPFTSVAAKSAEKNHAVWKVPAGVKKIRVRSWQSNGSKGIDRTLNVEPGEVFRIDAIED